MEVSFVPKRTDQGFLISGGKKMKEKFCHRKFPSRRGDRGAGSAIFPANQTAYAVWLNTQTATAPH